MYKRQEYGSARWGNAKDIEPFQAPKFEDNIILTKTERLMKMCIRDRLSADSDEDATILDGAAPELEQLIMAAGTISFFCYLH